MTVRTKTLTVLGCALLGVFAAGYTLQAVARQAVVYSRDAARARLEGLDAGEVQRRLDSLQWHRRTLTQAYDEVGRRNTKWDDAVRRGLDLTAQLYGVDPKRPGDVFERIAATLETALAAGCDDPLVAYVHARIVDWTDREVAAVEEHRRAAMRLAESHYPAFRRALALIFAADMMANTAGKRRLVVETATRDLAERGELLDRATALLPEVFKDSTIPDRQLKLIVRELVSGRQRLGMDRWQAYESVASVLAKSRDPDAAALPLIKAVVLTDYAWDARGTAYAANVSDENMTRFTERLAQANVALAEAIIKGTTDQAVGTSMMRIVFNDHDDDREMAAWFEIARRLSPGDEEPYNSRAISLLPRWGGSDAALLAFGRAAFARQDWGARSPFALINVHEWIAKGPPAKLGYLERADVCADIKAVYDPFLAKYPDSASDRSRYAHRLIECKAWREADAQLRRLGDRASMSAFGGRGLYDVERKLVATMLAAKR